MDANMWKEEYKDFFLLRLEAMKRKEIPIDIKQEEHMEEWFNKSYNNMFNRMTQATKEVLDTNNKIQLLSMLRKITKLDNKYKIYCYSVGNWYGICYWAVQYKLGLDKEKLINGMCDTYEYII
jgi:hypothetical protein